jgi:hypothetical protein
MAIYIFFPIGCVADSDLLLCLACYGIPDDVDLDDWLCELCSDEANKKLKLVSSGQAFLYIYFGTEWFRVCAGSAMRSVSRI